MKYILMMNTMKAGHAVPAWPKKDLQAHIAFMIAARASAAPGPGGAPLNMPIEVRPVASAPPPEMM